MDRLVSHLLLVVVIQAMELLDGYGRKKDATAICEAEIAAGPTDARIHAYASMLEIQLGKFDRARQNYSIALAKRAGNRMGYTYLT